MKRSARLGGVTDPSGEPATSGAESQIALAIQAGGGNGDE
jgi:hypothetical protein